MLVAASLVSVVAAPASIAHAEPTTQPIDVIVGSSKIWTSTGVTVKTGESITVDASGLIHFGPPPINRIGPKGRPRAACAKQGVTRAFPAPALDCWSLIGRIGTEPPFEVGSHSSFNATSDGELFLGINDNQLADNSGSWKTTISVTASGGTAPGGSSSKSNTLLFVIAGLVIMAVLAAFVFLSRRSRRRATIVLPAPPTQPHAPLFIHDDPPEAVAIPAAIILDEPIEVPAEESVGSFATVPAPFGTSVAPVEGEVVDVNIFEVEITNGTDLRVGYNYFPEGVDLHWQVRQGSLFAHGQFPTTGGGNMYHYVTLPLGVHLEPAPAAVDVQFTWAIGGVPFRYSVRRDPGL
jgi:hypothetical protein